MKNNHKNLEDPPLPPKSKPSETKETTEDKEQKLFDQIKEKLIAGVSTDYLILSSIYYLNKKEYYQNPKPFLSRMKERLDKSDNIPAEHIDEFSIFCEKIEKQNNQVNKLIKHLHSFDNSNPDSITQEMFLHLFDPDAQEYIKKTYTKYEERIPTGKIEMRPSVLSLNFVIYNHMDFLTFLGPDLYNAEGVDPRVLSHIKSNCRQLITGIYARSLKNNELLSKDQLQQLITHEIQHIINNMYVPIETLAKSLTETIKPNLSTYKNFLNTDKEHDEIIQNDTQEFIKNFRSYMLREEAICYIISGQKSPKKFIDHIKSSLSGEKKYLGISATIKILETMFYNQLKKSGIDIYDDKHRILRSTITIKIYSALKTTPLNLDNLTKNISALDTLSHKGYTDRILQFSQLISHPIDEWSDIAKDNKKSPRIIKKPS
ncbi:hypothetical protein KJ855_03800 [Patescibacteria group bacterium]|nr:hypothetical protein [Patescibacteria group bacterium]